MKQYSSKYICLKAALQQAELVVHLLQYVDFNSADCLVPLAQAAVESAAQWLGLFMEKEFIQESDL